MNETVVKEKDFCAPASVTGEDIIDIVIEYLEDHPDERHEPAYLLTLKATVTAFPCEE